MNSPDAVTLGKRIGLVVVLCCATTPAAAQRINTQAFIDPMDSYDVDRWLKSDGWSNGPAFLNGWRADLVDHAEGLLTLTLLDRSVDDKPYASGEYQTRDFRHYGRYEVTMRPAVGDGLVTGFFVYTGPQFDDPWDEIDIEFLGRDTTKLWVNYYTGGQNADLGSIELGFDAADAFHTYAFEWSPLAIRWYVDGRLVHVADGVRLPLPQAPGKIYAHLWAGAGPDMAAWLKPFAYPGVPISAEIDCISYRPLGSDAPGCSDLPRAGSALPSQ